MLPPRRCSLKLQPEFDFVAVQNFTLSPFAPHVHRLFSLSARKKTLLVFPVLASFPFAHIT